MSRTERIPCGITHGVVGSGSCEWSSDYASMSNFWLNFAIAVRIGIDVENLTENKWWWVLNWENILWTYRDWRRVLRAQREIWPSRKDWGCGSCEDLTREMGSTGAHWESLVAEVADGHRPPARSSPFADFWEDEEELLGLLFISGNTYLLMSLITRKKRMRMRMKLSVRLKNVMNSMLLIKSNVVVPIRMWKGESSACKRFLCQFQKMIITRNVNNLHARHSMSFESSYLA